jgi:hypothetical protein
MSTIPFDTLKLARDLRDKAHFTQEQAEGVTNALAEAFQDNVATKDDIRDLRSDIRDLEQRLIIRLGGMLVIAVGIILAAIRYLPPAPLPPHG